MPKKKRKSNYVSKIDMMKLGIAFTALDLENLTKVKELCDRVWERKKEKYESNNTENTDEAI